MRRRASEAMVQILHSVPDAADWLAARVRELRATLAVELHFNASDLRAASGHEWLYVVGSFGGREAGRCLNRAMQVHFPKLQVRGVKVIGPRERGSQFHPFRAGFHLDHLVSWL